MKSRAVHLTIASLKPGWGSKGVNYWNTQLHLKGRVQNLGLILFYFSCIIH